MIYPLPPPLTQSPLVVAPHLFLLLLVARFRQQRLRNCGLAFPAPARPGSNAAPFSPPAPAPAVPARPSRPWPLLAPATASCAPCSKQTPWQGIRQFPSATRLS